VIHIPASNDVTRPPSWVVGRRSGSPRRFQPTLDTFGETIAQESVGAGETREQCASQHIAVPAEISEPVPAPARELVPFASVLRRLA